MGYCKVNVHVHFLRFRKEIALLGNFGSKIKSYLFKMNFVIEL